MPSLPSLPPMTYEWPILLWTLALVPVLLLLYLLAQRRRRAYAMRFTNLALLREVAGRRPGLRRHVPPLFFLLGIGALLFSLARPSAVIAVPRDQADVMLVVDTSGSMTATDLKPSRMVAARLAAEKFVQALPPNTRVGLVEFSSRARLASPLTRDRAVVLTAIRGLDADGGTAIGDGLALALDVFRREAAGAQGTATPGAAAPNPTPSTADGITGEGTPGTVVLLSDGASSSGQPPQQAATRANQAHVVVHTVGIGERMTGARVGERNPAELDERALQEIAKSTGGEYFYAAQAGDLERIYTSIGSRVSWSEERTEVTALMSALGTFLLIVAGLFSLRWLNGLP
jgi:Ca-activated chloride channel homolog